MTPEQPRTDASSRERSPEHQFTLSIEQAAELYAKAGHPRTIRAVQKYCALNKLDCHKVETETGEKYLVTPASIHRHIAYIEEVRTVAANRDQTRTDANIRTMENSEQPPNGSERMRSVASVRIPEDRFMMRLEDENKFLRGQIDVKDGQIALKDKTIDALLERDRETNILVSQLQRMLGPLLAAPKHKEPSEQGSRAADTPE